MYFLYPIKKHFFIIFSIGEIIINLRSITIFTTFIEISMSTLVNNTHYLENCFSKHLRTKSIYFRNDKF